VEALGAVGYSRFMERPWETLRKNWHLNERVAFLNHGSFGACPIPVLDYQQALRLELERDPVQFMLRRVPELLTEVRKDLAQVVHAAPEDLVFTHNATSGVNAVLRSLVFHHGDEILTTNHVYNACKNTLDYVCARSGAKCVVADVPFPLVNEQQVVEAVVARVSSHTRLALLDHVTSATGLVLPIKELVARLKKLGVETLVDGAHAVGMVDVNLNDIGAAYYAANLHKWLCAPKGAGVLWVRRELQRQLVPGTISHGLTVSPEARFQALFDWQGTNDPTAWLASGEALRFMGSLLPGGLAGLREHNHRLALFARDTLCRVLGQPKPCPDSMVGSLVSVPIWPDHARLDVKKSRAVPSVAELYNKLLAAGFEVLISAWPTESERVLRVSAQVYNAPQDFERLTSFVRRLWD
jgi:isopenicillin-N epimerase